MIAALFTPASTSWIIVDPCAGEGEAVVALADAYDHRADAYTCELEKARHEAARAAVSKLGYGNEGRALRGDAFRVDFGGGDFAGLLYLNPPYDTDPVHGRLEQRWLERFAQTLCDGGRLAFVVPHYALEASAEFIASEFDEVYCFRFPDPEFEDYKQVVLIARKCMRRLEPDAEIVRTVRSWAENATQIVKLSNGWPKNSEFSAFEIPGKSYHSFTAKWRVVPFDIEGMIQKFRPMRRTSRGGKLEHIAGILPDLPIAEFTNRKFPVATPARPAHLAAGLAAGMFNGKRVSAKVPGMPDLLVKGTFDREYVELEQKENADGEVTGVVEVQQPRLTITVLDLSAGRYHTLRSAGATTGTRDPAAMVIEDLLDSYGPALARVMGEQCPAVYDPADPDPALTLAPVARPLFPAQAAAGSACAGLMGWRPGMRHRARGAAILLGEIGVGKTSVAIAVANTVARRPLVMCPPHLLDTWRDEVRTLLPGAGFRVLKTIADVDEAAADETDGVVFNVVSREVAKLGHGYEGITTGACPRCGVQRAAKPEDLARRRERCGGTRRVPTNRSASLAVMMAVTIAKFEPQHPNARAILNTGRAADRWLRSLAARKPEPVEGEPEETPGWTGLDPSFIAKVLDEAVCLLLTEVNENRSRLFWYALLAARTEDQARAVRTLLDAKDKIGWTIAGDLAKYVAILAPEYHDGFASAFTSNYGPRSVNEVIEKATPTEAQPKNSVYTYGGQLQRFDGVWWFDSAPAGSFKHARRIFENLCNRATWEYDECNEPLYQAAPTPRRFPLATYITRRHPRAFDLFVNDEAHESQGFDSSAQGIAAARLSGLPMPALRMTGSVMNGYAASLYGTMWLTSPWFRAEFGRGDLQRFLDRYGYRKRLLSDRDKETGDVVEFGSSSDRVVRSSRIIGDAPGILPLFLFRHLLRCSVTLHRADLKVHLPPCRHLSVKVKPDAELGDSFKRMFHKLVEQIRKDKFDKEKAGLLLGALSEVGSYLDRSTLDTGNRPDGSYVIAYPHDGDEVTRGESFDPSTRSAKESWLLDLLSREFREDRNVMVFTWHENLLPRLVRLIQQQFGCEVPALVAAKVPTAKRQAWIDREVVRAGARIMVANPATVQTGLNNLVWFNTEVFHENPGCNPITARQSVGRVDRLGAKKETRIYWPMFEGTIQQQLHALMLRKVAISTAADGLDAESVLIAAGGTDDPYMAGMSLGKQLLAMLERAELEASRAALPPPPKARKRSAVRARISP